MTIPGGNAMGHDIVIEEPPVNVDAGEVVEDYSGAARDCTTVECFREIARQAALAASIASDSPAATAHAEQPEIHRRRTAR